MNYFGKIQKTKKFHEYVRSHSMDWDRNAKILSAVAVILGLFVIMQGCLIAYDQTAVFHIQSLITLMGIFIIVSLAVFMVVLSWRVARYNIPKSVQVCKVDHKNSDGTYRCSDVQKKLMYDALALGGDEFADGDTVVCVFFWDDKGCVLIRESEVA